MAKKLKLEKSKVKEKWNLLGNAPEKSIFKGPHIELFSSTEILVEGCLGVYEYNENYLKLRLNTGALVLVGEDFDIISFEDKAIAVKGKITSLEFAV